MQGKHREVEDGGAADRAAGPRGNAGADDPRDDLPEALSDDLRALYDAYGAEALPPHLRALAEEVDRARAVASPAKVDSEQDKTASRS